MGDELSTTYSSWLADLKERVRTAQLRASLSVHTELLKLYWTIGNDIVERQQTHGWGSSVIDRLSADLRKSFPSMSGFSPRNLRDMRRFAQAWPDPEFWRQAVARIPWGHNLLLLQKLDDPELRLFYAEQTLVHGWARSMLKVHIEQGFHTRMGAAPSNFATTLPATTSDLAQQALKDPYLFDFLTLGPDARERDLEDGLVGHIRDFLLELGVGFAFLGRQYPVQVDDQDFFLDLLFYHCRLHCYFVVELKVDAFKPEYAGKLGFYLQAVDHQLRGPSDAPTIGLLLCASKGASTVVEYALRAVNMPMGVAEWQTQLVKSLPTELRSQLPSVESLEAELEEASEA